MSRAFTRSMQIRSGFAADKVVCHVRNCARARSNDARQTSVVFDFRKKTPSRIADVSA